MFPHRVFVKSVWSGFPGLTGILCLYGPCSRWSNIQDMRPLSPSLTEWWWSHTKKDGPLFIRNLYSGRLVGGTPELIPNPFILFNVGRGTLLARSLCLVNDGKTLRSFWSKNYRTLIGEQSFIDKCVWFLGSMTSGWWSGGRSQGFYISRLLGFDRSPTVVIWGKDLR